MAGTTRACTVIVAAVTLTLLTGCSGGAGSDSLADTPQQSQQKLLTMLDDTEALIGGDWENEDSPSPRGCELPGSTDEGVTFTGVRSKEGPALDDDAISDVVEFWEGEGFDAGSGGMGVLTSVMGVDRGNEAYYVELRIGEFSTQLHGQAACVPGDVLAELDRVEGE